MINLDPVLPHEFVSRYHTGVFACRLTVGDLTGDGFPEFVYQNRAAFLRVYTSVDNNLTVPPGTALTIYPYQPFTFNQACDPSANVPRDDFYWRALSRDPGPQASEGVIYDIDLDGKNELICIGTRRLPIGVDSQMPDIGLYVYHFTKPQGSQAIIEDGPADFIAVPLNDTNYFHCDDHVEKYPYHIRVCNLRGRALPQDIMVSRKDGTTRTGLFAYDNRATGSRLRDLLASGPVYDPPGVHPGHFRQAADIDRDGTDEMLSRDIVKVCYNASTGTYSTCGAGGNNFLWRMEFESLGEHPDDVLGVDFLATYKDQATGLVKASPGFEILIGPQLRPEKAGALWIYRALTGHVQQTWPRKVMSYQWPGETYQWTTQVGNPTTVEPGPASSWNQIRNAYQQPPNSPGGPDPQEVYVAPFKAANQLSVWVNAKSRPNYVPQPPAPGWTLAHSGHLIDSGVSLTAYHAANWCNNGAPVVAGPSSGRPVSGMFLADYFGTRDTIEFYSAITACSDRHVVLGWQGSGFIQYLSVVRCASNCDMYWGEAYSNAFAYDVLPASDSREEMIMTWSQPGSTPQLRIRASNENPAPYRPEPKPTRFISYRINPTHRYLDYSKLSGVRFYTERLLVGETGKLYGVPQDPSLSAPAHCCLVAAEGGHGPYAIALNSGVLPTGLSLQTVFNASVGNFLAIVGTPTEAAVRRLKFDVVDLDQCEGLLVQGDFWLTVNPGPGPNPLPDQAPRVLGAGFDDGSGAGVYLAANVSTPVTFKAWVYDVNDDATRVDVTNVGGAPLLLQLTPSGTGWTNHVRPFTGTATINAPVGDRYFTMVAVDQGGRASLPGPYLVVDGGPGIENPAFPSGAGGAGQTAATTPRIARVDHASTIPGAETTDAAGSLTIEATIGFVPAGASITAVQAEVKHSLTGEVYPVALSLVSGALWRGTWNSPPREMGWGYYTVRVRATASTNAVSDWWPSLSAH